ncbi:hypothetical protein BJX96DRAFT_150803 [Aspergillus floccosus]
MFLFQETRTMLYKYNPLPQDRKTIRLLRLYPSVDKGAPIRSQLLEYFLGKRVTPLRSSLLRLGRPNCNKGDKC